MQRSEHVVARAILFSAGAENTRVEIFPSVLLAATSLSTLSLAPRTPLEPVPAGLLRCAMIGLAAREERLGAMDLSHCAVSAGRNLG